MKLLLRTQTLVLFLALPGLTASAQQALPIVGLGHAGVRVSDIPTAKKFYEGQLGFNMAFDLMKKNEPSSLMLDYYKVNDTQFLEIYPGLTPDAVFRMTHVAFITRDIDTLHSMMEERGVKPGPINTGLDGNKSFGVRPPPGQQLGFLEFTQYLPGSLHSNTAGKDMSDDELSSNMQFAGIYVTDMDAALAFYQKMGFPEVWRGKPEGLPEGLQVDVQVPGVGKGYLELISLPHPPTREQAGHIQHFGFATPGILVTRKTVESRGLTLSQPLHKSPDGRMEFSVMDPDGTEVIFRDGPPGPFHTGAHVTSKIMIYDMATQSSHLLATLDGNFQAPVYSPDGSYMLMNTPQKLYRVSTKTGEATAVDTGTVHGINNDHGITHDGSQFAVSAQNIFLMPASGGQPKQMTSKTPSYFHGFSPDGKWLAFCAERDGNFDIYRIPVSGGEEQRLTTDIGYDDGSEYSPDGKWIYFNSNRTGSWDIWRIPADGGGPNDAKAEQITNDALEDWFAHFSPDGKWMVLISFPTGIPNHPPGKNVTVRVMPAPSSKAGYQAGKIKPEPILTFFGGQGSMNVNSWSPDSKSFAYVTYAYSDN